MLRNLNWIDEMKSLVGRWLIGIIVGCIGIISETVIYADDPLPSWNQGSAKKNIIEFVEAVTAPESIDFVPQSERIAVFDNDGTLWVEQPMYVQLQFLIERIKVLAPNHPEWNNIEPFAAILKGDLSNIIKGNEKAIIDLIMVTHAGMTTEHFETLVSNWLASARHPKTGKLYTQMVYQPMLELLDYLRAKGFKTFIVSGGGSEFMRPWTEDVYGIPPERVVGSSIKTKFEVVDGKPVLIRLPEIDFINDGCGKPVGILQYIGRRPIAAFGNSDGDLQMLQWTCDGSGIRFCMYIHHTDAVREWAYDISSNFGRLDKGLKEAAEKGWTVVDMKRDWNIVFADN